MSEDSSEFKPLPRKRRKSAEKKPRKPRAVGASTPSAPRRTARSRKTGAADDAPAARSPRRPRAARWNPFGLLKYVGFVMVVGLGVYVLMNLQPAPPSPPADFTPDPNATLVPTSVPIFPLIPLPVFPTAAPTFTPTPTIPEVAIVAGHWAQEAGDGVPAVLDSGAVCPDGLREVEITKSVADKTLALIKQRGYHAVLLQEFDPRYSEDPPFAPKAFLSIHADSCLQGGDFAYATGYKIAHAEPSNNEQEDSRLVTCLTRSYDRVAALYDKPFNANTITRNMTEYHAFRKIDTTTPAAIIELGFLGHDRAFLVEHQDEMAEGLARGLDDFLKQSPCVPSTSTPEPTETVLP
jgi:N-acetylmuramoyl-L-alanine amidase